jgi:hypothetical protein
VFCGCDGFGLEFGAKFVVALLDGGGQGFGDFLQEGVFGGGEVIKFLPQSVLFCGRQGENCFSERFDKLGVHTSGTWKQVLDRIFDLYRYFKAFR